MPEFAPQEYRQVVAKKICPSCGQTFDLEDDDSCCPEDGAMLAPLMNDPFIGQIFTGSLEIISELGSGASGKVYKARQLNIDRTVAVKLLQSKQISDMDKIRRFEREAKALSRLSHPNIIAIFDYGLLPLPYMVMEYVDGVSLEDIIEKPLPPNKALNIAIQVCDALDEAHKNGVVHRDLKPSNIMLIPEEGGNYKVKVLDFGLARWTPDDESNAPTVTITGDVVGTPAYMSPEQCLGKAPDNRSDIYALGCILYELVSGVRPFEASTIVEYMNKHTTQEPRSFLETNPGLNVPDLIEEVVLKAMEKDPKKRFQAISTFKAALEKCLGEVESGKGRRRIRPRRKLYKGRIVLILALSMLITGGIFFNQCYPEYVQNLLFQQAFDSGKSAFANRDFARAESEFGRAAEIASSFGEKDRQKRKFNSLNELLHVYIAESKWADAVQLNDQLLAQSGIEDRLRKYNHNGLTFFLPSKWFIQRGVIDWNEMNKFKIVHTLRWSQLYLQMYEDRLNPYQIASLEQKIYSKVSKDYKLVSARKIKIGQQNDIDAELRDFEIVGDFGIDPSRKYFRSIDTGKKVLHRHVYFGSPGRVFKLRIEGDSIDFAHLCRALDKILASVIVTDSPKLDLNSRVDIGSVQFYASSKKEHEGALAIVLKGQKPEADFDIPVNF